MSLSETIGEIAMKFGTICMPPFEMNCNNVGVPLTFHRAPSSFQNLHPITLVIPHLEIVFCDLFTMKISQGTFRFYECLIIDFLSIVCRLITLKD